MVLRSVRAGQGDDPRLQDHRRTSTTLPGRAFPRTCSSASSNAGTSIPRPSGMATPAMSDGYAMVDPNKLALLTPGIDRKTGEYLRLRRARDGRRQLSARAAHRAGEVRPEQHALPDDAGGGREQAQHADREAGQVQEPVGSRRAACPRSCRPSARRTAQRYAGYTIRKICNEMHDFYREANVKELQRLCFRASSFPELAMSSEGSLRGAGRQRRRLRPAWTTSRAAYPRRLR